MSKIAQEEGLLWNDMEQKSWGDLARLLRNKVENLEEEERMELLMAAEELSDEPFPESELELYFVLNREAHDHPQRIWITDM